MEQISVVGFVLEVITYQVQKHPFDRFAPIKVIHAFIEPLCGREHRKAD